jgi:NADH dehydrogenase (ubiquinone) 1 alpha/beta subcomplex 1, acyl-carrier protein
VQAFLDRAEVTERVLSVLKNFEKVNQSKLTATSHFVNDLGLDSLDAVEVCLAEGLVLRRARLTHAPSLQVSMALEEEFLITIPDAEAEKLLSVEDAINFVVTHPNAK